MKKYIAFIMLVFCCGATWQTVTVDQNGKPIANGVNNDCNADHVMQENEYPADYVLPTVAYKFWKKVGNDWLAMTPAEQQVVTDAENTIEANYQAWSKREKAMMRLMIKEINLLRVAAGLPARTEAQVKAALKAEME